MFLEEISDFLIDYGSRHNLALSGDNVFCGYMPDEADNCVALYERGGYTRPETEIADDEILTLDVVTRAGDYKGARSLAYGIYFLLDRLYDTVISGHRYTYLTATRPPYHLGRDVDMRHSFALGFIVYRERD